MSALIGALVALLAAQLALVLDNLRHFRAPAAATPQGDPLVSVLVPARNESGAIGACVAAVMAQAGVRWELVVLDDGSDDGTAEAARAAAGLDARVRVVAGAPLPPGWVGKCHACHQLAALARGEWWLFLDADTRLAPGALAAAAAWAERERADLLALFPHQQMESPGERLMLPLLMFVLLGFLPLGLAARLAEPSLSAANGQFMWFSPEAYRACGGHAGVADALVEDVALARRIKACGRRLVIADGGPWISCRMYDGLASLWRGFRKNLYPALGGRPGPFLGALGLLVGLHVLPLPLLVFGLAANAPWWPGAALALGLGLVIRAILAWRLHQPAMSVWAHPLAVGMLAALAIDSWRGVATGGVSWKGRVYAGRRPAE